MHSHHHRCLLLILSVSVLGSTSAAQEPNADQQPARKLPMRAEIEKKYDRDGDGQLSIEERRNLWEDIAEERVEVPPQLRERVRRMLQQFRDTRKLPGGPKPKAAGDQTLAGMSEKVVVHRDLVYGDGGGRPLKLDLVLPQPAPDKSLPLVVFIHGGGWRGGDKAGGIARVAPLVATGDYVGATIGYRLSGEATWPAQIHDCKAAIRWLRANADRYHIDPERIGVWGSSAGGHLVNMLGTSGEVTELEGNGGSAEHSSRVSCVVPFCGPTNFLAPKRFEGGRSPSAVDLLLGGSIEDKQDTARAASPITYVSADDPPFLIVHGTDDQTVPFEQAEMLYDALKKAGVDATFVRIIGGSHAVGGPEVMQRVNDFFEKHLRGQDVQISDEPVQASPAR